MEKESLMSRINLELTLKEAKLLEEILKESRVYFCSHNIYDQLSRKIQLHNDPNAVLNNDNKPEPTKTPSKGMPRKHS